MTPMMKRLSSAVRAVLLVNDPPNAVQIVRVILTELGTDPNDDTLLAGVDALPSRHLDCDDVAAVLRRSLEHVMEG